MALQKDYMFTFNYVNQTLKIRPELTDIFNSDENITTNELVRDAYFKVDNLIGDKNNISIHLGIYTDAKKEFLLDTKIINFTSCVSDLSSNIFKQAYDYIKSLSEFKDAIDC